MKPILSPTKAPKGPAHRTRRKGPPKDLEHPPTNPGPRRPKGPAAAKAHVNKVARQVLRRGLKAVNAARVAKGMLPVTERVKARVAKIPVERYARKVIRKGGIEAANARRDARGAEPLGAKVVAAVKRRRKNLSERKVWKERASRG